MNMKQKARLEMLKKMSKDKSSEMNSGLGDMLKGKKLSKVEVIAKDKEGLKKGLSKAQQILKAKMGDEFLKGDEVDESEDDSMEECPRCEGEGCEACSDDEMEEC